MNHAHAEALGIQHRPWAAGDYLLLAMGVTLGAGVGVGVTRWVLRRRVTTSTAAVGSADEMSRRAELLRKLATHLGNPDLDPANRPMGEILLELQYTLGLGDAGGEWTAETEKAIRDLLASPPSGGNPWRPRRRGNPVGCNDELEPDENWESTYQQQFEGALQACHGDASVVAFDQCVVSLLERIFPGSGSFMLCPGTGSWKRAARERARCDLTQALGPTEIHARATLTRDIGLEARHRGADLGQAVRVMAEHAWPTVAWDSPERAPWQSAFARLASTIIQC